MDQTCIVLTFSRYSNPILYLTTQTETILMRAALLGIPPYQFTVCKILNANTT